MRIRKFYEAEEQLQLSKDTLEQILDKLLEISESIDSNKGEITSITDTLSNFLSNSKSTNTQIDDSYVNLNSIKSKLSDISNLMKKVNSNLKDYYDTGEKDVYEL